MLTRSQFSMFGLDAKICMIEEMGLCIYTETAGNNIVKLYSLFNFTVEVFFHLHEEKAYKAEPVFNCRTIMKHV